MDMKYQRTVILSTRFMVLRTVLASSSDVRQSSWRLVSTLCSCARCPLQVLAERGDAAVDEHRGFIVACFYFSLGQNASPVIP
ncbi:MAG TPA: hypothetical protein VMT62_14720 [Syntrophorhabdaceae bacterium]|nr:hypothetical protein [Syntrophorhabdaceae bacterium]